MNWYLFILGSSVGKKILMAVTGLCLIGFLAVHLLGNVMAFAGAEAFNGYAAKLHSLQPYLTVFNIGLATLGLVHLVVGIILFFENLRARPTRYKVYKNPGGRTIGSNTMAYTGVLILVFVIFHLLKFTFVDKSVTPIYQQMAATFANPLWVFLYVVAMVIVAVHVGFPVCGGHGYCRCAHQSRLMEYVSDFRPQSPALHAAGDEAGFGGDAGVWFGFWDFADLLIDNCIRKN
jgi:succinate dehydrogenase / fumarate reductase cytochrome b subunit